MLDMLLLAMLQTTPNVPASTNPPVLRNQRGIITLEDYPNESLNREEFGVVSMLLRVSANGQVTSCAVTESSGFKRLDERSCSLFKSRARFEPAKGSDGLQTTGEYRAAISWGTGKNFPRTTIEVPLAVNRVPQDYINPTKTRLLFDSSGRVTVCEVTDTSGNNAIDQAVCTYVRQRLTIAPPMSASPNIPAIAVRYLTASASATKNEARNKN